MFSSDESRSSWAQSIRATFTFDGRSLAAMRIVVGVLLLFDTLGRWTSLKEFFTDSGLLTSSDCKKALHALYGSHADLCWSANFLSGELWFAQLLTVILLLASLLLIVGFQTRIATLVCWFLLVSFQHRNPLILTPGDTVLRLILFWAIFIPWGKFWSLDRRIAVNRPGASNVDPLTEFDVFSPGTIGLLVQFICIQLFEGLSKANTAWWSGDAITNIIQFDTYSRAWTSSLLQSSFLLKIAAFFTLVLQLIISCLLLVPWQNSWWRTLNLILFATFYGIWIASTDLGLQYLIYLSSLLFLVPGGLWETPFFSWIRPAWNSDSESNLATVVGEESFRDYSGGRKTLAFSFCLALLSLILGWNIALTSTPVAKVASKAPIAEKNNEAIEKKSEYQKALPILSPKPFRWLIFSSATHQRFHFLGTPPTVSQWLTYNATLKNGKQIDLRHLQPAVKERPDHLATYERNLYWRQLQQNLADPKFQFLREKLASYLTKSWNDSNREDKQVARLLIVSHWHPVANQKELTHQVWHDSQSITKSPASDSFMEIFKNRMKNKISN